MAKIQVYGGRARTGSIVIEPFSKTALDKRDQGKLKSSMTAFLNEFPKMSYGTDWGKSWEDNNLGYIGQAAVLLGGGEAHFGSGILGSIVSAIGGKISPMIQMMAGSSFKPPVLTDSWTQLSAQLDEAKSNIEFSVEMLAYPVLRNGYVHVEGLRGDPENLDQALNIGPRKCSSMWDWVNLGREALMPDEFSSERIKSNLAGVVNNMNGQSGTSGKLVIGGVDKAWSGLTGMVFGDKSIQDGGNGIIEGIGEALTGLTGVSQRVGYTFTVQIFDCDGNKIFNSKAPDCPLDFFITDLGFDFSPHLVQLIDDKGMRNGSCPEWCKISMTLSSSTRVSPNQVIKMCEWQKE